MWKLSELWKSRSFLQTLSFKACRIVIILHPGKETGKQDNEKAARAGFLLSYAAEVVQELSKFSKTRDQGALNQNAYNVSRAWQEVEK